MIVYYQYKVYPMPQYGVNNKPYYKWSLPYIGANPHLFTYSGGVIDVICVWKIKYKPNSFIEMNKLIPELEQHRLKNNA